MLADPVSVSVPVVPYRPLPSHSALGLSAFYIALLTTFCGFLGAVIVNTSIDAVLGYATTEIGRVWRQRQPVAISRWQTLLAKWVMAVGLTVILTGLMLFSAVVILNMNSPHFVSLWLLSWFAASVVAIGTLVLFAALGTLGQLVALLVFVYLALASSGGTVPLDALSGFFRFFANFEPLRQILDGVRAILYFDARGGAGLTRAWVASGLGLVFWMGLGILVTTWYDRKRLYRMPQTSWSTSIAPSSRIEKRHANQATPVSSRTRCRHPPTTIHRAAHREHDLKLLPSWRARSRGIQTLTRVRANGTNPLSRTRIAQQQSSDPPQRERPPRLRSRSRARRRSGRRSPSEAVVTPG